MSKFLYRIREALRTLILLSAARLLGYDGAEFVEPKPRLQPATTQPSAKAMDEARR